MEKLTIALFFSFKKFPWKFDASIQDAFREFAKKPVVSRRKYERANITLAAHYRTSEGSRNIPGRILDLSGGGVRMRCRESMEAGTSLRLSFAVGQAMAINDAVCTIVRREAEENGYVYGLSFADKDGLLGEKIDRYLQRASLKS
jgi:c-di-GMP-binding flagellar brake protein YcgR